jgi:5-methylcytosine-specific restriction endonuclease McrA
VSATSRRGWAGTGSTYRWRTTRLLVLARDAYQCQIRGPRCAGRADSVDHIRALVDGGSKYDPTNLRAACTPCNAGRRDYGNTPTSIEPRTNW